MMVTVRFSWRPLGRVTLAALVLAGASCKNDEGIPPGVLVIVDGEEVSTERLEKAMEAIARRTPRDFSSLDVKKDILWKIIDETVVAAQARKAGYEDDPEVKGLVRQLIVRKFLEDKLQPQIEAVEITSEDVQKYYDENIELYISHERVIPAVIYVRKPLGATAEQISALRKRAEEARAKAIDLEPAVLNFGTVAKDFSDEPRSRDRGGEIGWITDGSTPSYVEEELADVAFELEEVGDISEVIETERFFYVVRIVDRRARQRHQLATVRDAIRSQLLRARQAEVRTNFLEELRSGLEVRMPEGVEAMLESIEAPTASRGKPAETVPVSPERRTTKALAERAAKPAQSD